MAKEKKPTLEGYLKAGKITQELFDTISKIPNPDKKARTLETLGRRIAKRGTLDK